jgi:hypothetical protein
LLSAVANGYTDNFMSVFNHASDALFRRVAAWTLAGPPAPPPAISL